MTRAKSLLEVKDGLTFLDVDRAPGARPARASRRAAAARADELLRHARGLAGRAGALPRPRGRPARATSSRARCPSCSTTTSSPVAWPADPELEWAPPGHGDLYTALADSGMLEALLDRGYRYAFVSNADNLGAVLDPRILAWIAARGAAVPDGGRRPHRGRPQGRPPRPPRADGGLVLREIAQTPEEDLEAFQDIARHRFFNTNNLWVDLRALRRRAARRATASLELPMIVNRKTVDPADPSSPAVVQLETAMGAAIDVFDGARGRARAALALRARSRRPTTCSCCARTPTC